MPRTIIEAPGNPYRTDARDDGMQWLAATPGAALPAPARFDRDDGPGMTAGDIDAIARRHHLAGYAKAEREYEAKLEVQRARLAEVFDEGYTLGRRERAQGLARDVFTRLFEPEVKLIEARGRVKQGTRAGDEAHAGFAEVEAALKGVREFVSALFAPHDDAASERAAAQVARDEG